jgi:hypothetical protein
MKVGVTGASGKLGKRLIQSLITEHEVVTFGRQESDVNWTLGITPSPNQLSGIDVLIHLGWSLKDRKNDFHLNVGGTATLASAANSSGIPFLFVSSVAATSSSFYGISKLGAEKLVAENHGFTVRIGLIPESNNYSGNLDKFLGIYPSLPSLISITRYEDFESFIRKWLVPEFRRSTTSEPELCLSFFEKSKNVFAGNSRIAIPIPFFAIKTILFLGNVFTLRARNLQDALSSVTTTCLERK